jgi:hypothetical protein
MTLAVGVVVALGLLATGCGGSSDSGSEITASSITKAEFVKKVDAICTRRNTELEGELAKFIKSTNFNPREGTEDAYITLVGQFYVPALKRESARIRALGAPQGDEDEVGELVEALERGLETAEKEPKKVVDLSSVVFKESNQLGKEYGLTACEQGA